MNIPNPAESGQPSAFKKPKKMVPKLMISTFFGYLRTMNSSLTFNRNLLLNLLVWWKKMNETFWNVLKETKCQLFVSSFIFLHFEKKMKDYTILRINKYFIYIVEEDTYLYNLYLYQIIFLIAWKYLLVSVIKPHAK